MYKALGLVQPTLHNIDSLFLVSVLLALVNCKRTHTDAGQPQARELGEFHQGPECYLVVHAGTLLGTWLDIRHEP